MYKVISWFYWTKYEDGHEPVDILKIEKVLAKNPTRLALRLSICDNAIANYNKEYNQDAVDIDQLGIPYTSSDLPIVIDYVPYIITNITPPKIRSNIDEILKNAGMSYYDEVELCERIGHTSIFTFKPRSVYNDWYYKGSGKYLNNRWLTDNEKEEYFSRMERVRNGK